MGWRSQQSQLHLCAAHGGQTIDTTGIRLLHWHEAAASLLFAATSDACYITGLQVANAKRYHRLKAVLRMATLNAGRFRKQFLQYAQPVFDGEQDISRCSSLVSSTGAGPFADFSASYINYDAIQTINAFGSSSRISEAMAWASKISALPHRALELLRKRVHVAVRSPEIVPRQTGSLRPVAPSPGRSSAD